MPATSLYLRPDENVFAGGSVSTSTGTLDTTYTVGALVDEILGNPAKATSGTAGWTVTISSATISGIGILNHNIDGGRSIVIGGGISATIAAPAARPNGIPYGACWLGGPYSGVTSVSVTVTGNSKNLVIGELMGGPMRQFPGGGLLADIGGTNQKRGASTGARSVNPADDGSASRSWRGSVLATLAQLNDIDAWFEAQKNGSRPSMFVPDTSQPTAFAVELLEPEWTYKGTRYLVTVTLQELTRERW